MIPLRFNSRNKIKIKTILKDLELNITLKNKNQLAF